LCAIDYTGVISVETVDTKEHSVTSEVFLAWIKGCVLPQMQAAPLSRSVLVLDNARIHDRVRLEIACTAVGVVVLWLPAYSCDFSPIELVFNNAKRVLKEKFGRRYTAMSLSAMLTTAIYTALTAEQMCDTFEHCLIKVTAAERAAAY
jgi:transposase